MWSKPRQEESRMHLIKTIYQALTMLDSCIELIVVVSCSILNFCFKKFSNYRTAWNTNEYFSRRRDAWRTQTMRWTIWGISSWRGFSILRSRAKCPGVRHISTPTSTFMLTNTRLSRTAPGCYAMASPNPCGPI